MAQLVFRVPPITWTKKKKKNFSIGSVCGQMMLGDPGHSYSLTMVVPAI